MKRKQHFKATSEFCECGSIDETKETFQGQQQIFLILEAWSRHNQNASFWAIFSQYISARL